MFAGIIEKTGKIQAVRHERGIVRVSVALPRGWKLAKGQSISIQGICSTVVAMDAKSFSVEYMPETLRASTAGAFAKGGVVNLERSLKVGDRIEGHFVQGHVEGVGSVRSIVEKGPSREVEIQVPSPLRRFLAPKGSVAIDGVSLTIARKSSTTITVALIPHTLHFTSLGLRGKGDSVNIETDVLARQLAALRR